jgi:hypothetical protein
MKAFLENFIAGFLLLIVLVKLARTHPPCDRHYDPTRCDPPRPDRISKLSNPEMTEDAMQLCP